MLRSMRHISQTWLIKGLLLFLVITFCLWGVGDMFRGNRQLTKVATVGPSRIVLQELEDQFERDYENIRQLAGPDFTKEQAKKEGLVRQSLENLIKRNLVDLDIKRLGLLVSTEDALAPLRQNPNLFDSDGKLNRAAFNRILQQMKSTEAGFVEALKFDIAGSLIQQTLTFSPAMPKILVDTMLKAATLDRVVNILTLDETTATVVPAADETKIAAYYDTHKKQFEVSESRDIAVLHLPIDKIMTGITVSDEDIAAAYEEHKKDYVVAAKRSFVQVVTDEAQAKKLLAAAKADHSLAAAAKKLNLINVSVDDMQESSLPEQLRDPIFSASKGEIIGPIQSDLGYHVIQITAATEAKEKSLQDMKSTIAGSLKQQKAEDELQAKAGKLDDALGANRALADIAKEFGGDVLEFKNIGGDRSKLPEALFKLPYGPGVYQQAMSLGEGENGALQNDDKGGLFVVRNTALRPAHVPPLNEVKAQVTEKWQKSVQKNAAADIADRIAADVRAGKTLSAAAAQKGAHYQAAVLVKAAAPKASGLPAPLYPAIADMIKGDVRILSVGDKQYVLQLAEMRNGSASDLQKQQISLQLKRDVGESLAEEYLHNLRSRYPTSIKEGAVKSLERTADQ